MPATTEFFIQLNDGKVMKRFGAHPERGKLLRGHTIKQERPRKMFERRSDAYDLILPVMQLRSVRKGWWQVTVPLHHVKEVRKWLIQYCS